MPRAALYLSIAAIVLVALGAALLLYARQVQRGYRQLEVVWTAADSPTPEHFRIAAFPVGLAERGVPERAIIVTLAEWNDPIGVVHWWRSDDEEVAVQRRLLRVDPAPDRAAPMIDALNQALPDLLKTDDREIEYTLGAAADERRLVVLGADNLRDAYDYTVTDTGDVVPLRMLASGDKGALITAGLWAFAGVVLAWTAILCAIIGAVLKNNARRKIA